MSKFLCMGMPLPDVIAASTVNAAMALKRPELGSLKPGSVGDATLISIKEGQFDYVDVVGEHLIGDRKIVSEGVVIGGRWWHPKEVAEIQAARGLTRAASLGDHLKNAVASPAATVHGRVMVNCATIFRAQPVGSIGWWLGGALLLVAASGSACYRRHVRSYRILLMLAAKIIVDANRV